MQRIPDNSGQNSGSQTSWEIGSSSKDFDRDSFKELAKRANSVPLDLIAKKYKIQLDNYNKKIICPFSHHKGGRESTASFYFYPETNTFWCFGCKTGVSCCDFVAAMEKISFVQAANKIIKVFENNMDEDLSIDKQDYPERLSAIMNFSKAIREKISSLDEDDLKQAEEISKAFDFIYQKHELSNEALQTLIEKLLAKLI